MPSQSASIQSYFSPQPSPAKSLSASQPPFSSSSSQAAPHPDTADTSSSTNNAFVPGDGFTADELASAPDPLPLTGPFTPPHGIPYKEVKLSQLGPAERGITFTGRIVNIYAPSATFLRRMPKGAMGCLRCTVADGEGVVTVRLWHAHHAYPLRLGSLITVWTTYVTLSEHEGLSTSSVPLYTSIFPEHERASHVQIHADIPENEQRCKKPLGYTSNETPMAGLMTLSSFAAGGYGVPDAKILVCVKSVGARKKSKPPIPNTYPPTSQPRLTPRRRTVSRKDNTAAKNATVFLFDHTAQASLTLWDAAATSPAPWKPHATVLLLTRAGCRRSSNNSSSASTWLSVQANTTVDVDPHTRDARWLRGFAQQLLRRRRSCNPASPLPGFAAAEVEAAGTRVLWSLADLDGAARRAGPGERLGGFVSVVLTEVNLVALWRRGMLACAECECGHALFANAVAVTCAHCERRGVKLKLNPRLLGPVIDETGGIATGKLVFKEEAWVELLGRGVEELLAADVETLRALEERMMFVRVSLIVGWVGAGEDGWEGVGRICVMGVRV